jgi:hypothetical protein
MNWTRWNVPFFLWEAKQKGVNVSYRPNQYPKLICGLFIGTPLFLQSIQHHSNIRRNTKASEKPSATCTETCQDNPKKALICHYNSTDFETLCIAKAAVDSHLSKHDRDHCGECNDIDYCGEPPVGSIECNRDTGKWTVAKVWNWTQPTKLTASDVGGYDYLGWSVATSGNQVFAGSCKDDNDRGSVSVFELNQSSGNWEEQVKLLASDRIASAFFGSSLAVSGEILVVGAYYDHKNGSAYVFEKDSSSGNWGETAKLRAIDGAPYEYFGSSVGVYGNTIVVGAYNDGDNGYNSGCAYVFEKSLDTGNWTQVSKLIASDGSSHDWFGYRVAVFGNRIVVGSPFQNEGGYGSGSVYVFEFNATGSMWEERAKLTASDAGAYHFFGSSVAISKDVILAGAPRYNHAVGSSYWSNFVGHAYTFNWDTSARTWEETANLVASDARLGDNFGYSVAIDEDLVIVGARNDDGIVTRTGAAYVFAKNETSATWEEQVKLFANDGSDNDWFGRSVGIYQDVVVVGSPLSDPVNYDNGAVYIYDKN